MNLPIDNNLNPVPVLYLQAASDYTDTTLTFEETKVIRIYAVTDVRLKSGGTGDGVFIPEGTIEYFGVYAGDSMVIEGTVNLM